MKFTNIHKLNRH